MLGDEWLDLDSQALYLEFDRWIRDVSETPYWSPDSQDGQRIHWESFETARKHPSKREEFAQAGCYFWGWGSGIDCVKPRYIGQTGRKLGGRILGRYVGKPRTDRGRSAWCRLAADYGDLMRSGKWRDLPGSILVPYYRAFGRPAWIKSTIDELKNQGQSIEQIAETIRREGKPIMGMRLGAPDFAKHGIEEMWVALFPVKLKEAASELEKSLIPIVNQWNQQSHRPLLLNQHHI